MRPKRFGTFEKWAPGAHTYRTEHAQKKNTTHNISDDMTVDDFEAPN